MIGILTGIILEKTPPYLLLEVNHVGYELQAPMTTFYQLPEIKNTVTLYTHLSIREDAHQLYGFSNKRDRDLFRTLIKISGIGPKLGLSILSGIDPEHFIHAIAEEDKSRLVKIPGIGKKTVDRLMIECRSHIQKLATTTTVKQNYHINCAYDDAIEAMTALGYKPNDAKKVIDQIYKVGLKTEELIRHALAHMV